MKDRDSMPDIRRTLCGRKYDASDFVKTPCINVLTLYLVYENESKNITINSNRSTRSEIYILGNFSM